MTIAVGEYVLDHVAASADDGGAAEEVGIRGLVWHVAANVADDQTGEVRDVLQVATSHHAQLRTISVPASDVARHLRASKTDAARYVTLTGREIAKAGSKAKQWLFDVQQVAVAVLRDAPDRRDIPSIFPTDDEVANYERAHPDEADGWHLRRRLEESTRAHRARSEA